MLFEVLLGSYNVKIPGKKEEKTYDRGDVIETNEDLVEKWGDKKFKRLYDKEALQKKVSGEKSSENSESPKKKTVKLIKKKETADAVSN